MAYLRLSPASNANWTARTHGKPASETWGQRRYGALPARRRRRGGDLLLGLIAMPLGAWGLWLLLGTPIPPDPPDAPPAARPLIFQVPSPGLTVVVSHEPPPSNRPETWSALPTAASGPVVAAPLADASPASEADAGCRDAPSLAAQMTCIDPTLGEAERRMAAAYDAVLAAGVAPPVLGRSQARWLAARDDAAQASPEDLLAAYQQRESQLRGLAAALEQKVASAGMTEDRGGKPYPRAFTGAAPST